MNHFYPNIIIFIKHLLENEQILIKMSLLDPDSGDEKIPDPQPWIPTTLEHIDLCPCCMPALHCRNAIRCRSTCWTSRMPPWTRSAEGRGQLPEGEDRQLPVYPHDLQVG